MLKERTFYKVIKEGVSVQKQGTDNSFTINVNRYFFVIKAKQPRCSNYYFDVLTQEGEIYECRPSFASNILERIEEIS